MVRESSLKPGSGRRSQSARPPIRPRSPAALSRVFIRQAHSFSNYCTKWGCNIATPPLPPSTQRGAGLTLRQPELANSLLPWAGPVHRQPINEPLNRVAPPTSHLCRDIYILKTESHTRNKATKNNLHTLKTSLIWRHTGLARLEPPPQSSYTKQYRKLDDDECKHAMHRRSDRRTHRRESSDGERANLAGGEEAGMTKMSIPHPGWVLRHAD
ncbi:hypothetical protein E2C01_095654 [Portunus trituberculatus]|uniref:Uncharacterized protein n=1 Tax=Portunus trituberculatus TaxID=210409 RepID=A0A5B7JZY3_PORTR|nr:hypothetical protein [Portunus trituberculatus]